MPAKKRKVSINRQAVILGMRFVLLLMVVGVNGYLLWLKRDFRPEIVVFTVLTLPLFHLGVVFWWEQTRLRMVARKAGETLVIPPHYAWNVHRDSRSDWSNIPGTLALTENRLRFVSSPLYTNEDIDRAIPLQQIVRVSTTEREQKPGHYLVVTLPDGAKIKFKLVSAKQQSQWLHELQGKVSITA